MIGCSEFCGAYDWTFEWLRRNYGEGARGRRLPRWDRAWYKDLGASAVSPEHDRPRSAR